MRTLLIGGSRFLRRHLLAELLAAGHAVATANGEERETDLPSAITHIRAERRQFVDRRADLDRFMPDAVIDLSAMSPTDAEAVAAVIDPGVRLTAVSSIDVYRAFGAALEGAHTDALPLAEDAPLRSTPLPGRVRMDGWSYGIEGYDKLGVERVYVDRGARICRLPLTYGENDYRRREDFVLARLRAGRRQIPIGPATFRISRGYAPELARGLRLASERGEAGMVFNLAEREGANVGSWMREIVVAAGARVELVRVPEEVLPDDLELTRRSSQDVFVATARAEHDLGWLHAPWKRCVRRSVEWHLANPPSTSGSFLDDELALVGISGSRHHL
jgi:nucleoside-diphosphate-sugar epimerase